ncbi:MAG TPA: hypothetical protein VGS57_09295 [Thermoanaerobaculia bacterium]|jgi:hypothetical protein|nr:hypothetical protein [Thermoanaerobaculia bacterium]
MPKIWVTIWRGGDATSPKVWLDDKLLTGWEEPPEDPMYVRRGWFVMRELEINSTHDIECEARQPGHLFWLSVVDQTNYVLLDRSFALPPNVSYQDQFRVR